MSDNKTLAEQIIIPSKTNSTSSINHSTKPSGRDNSPVWMQRTTLSALLLALVVVVFGAFVRLTDAGLGCPDWPGCYGLLDVPQTAEEIALAESTYEVPVEPQKAWNEMIHRYLASTLGFLILVINVFAFRTKKHRLLSTALLGMVIFQGMLGMWTVTLLLKPVIVMGHLIGGLTVTSMLLWLWFKQKYPINRYGLNRLSSFAIIALFVLIVQIALGGWTSTNYAATACPDFPTCQNQIWPDGMDFSEGFVMWRGLGVNYEGGVLATPARIAIHFTHRLWAITTVFFIVLLGIFAVKRSKQMRFENAGGRLRNSALLMKLLLVVQLVVAVVMIKSGFKLGISTAHNAFALLLLLATVAVVYFAREND